MSDDPDQDENNEFEEDGEYDDNDYEGGEEDNDPSIPSIAKISSTTTPFGFEIKLINPLPRNSFLTTVHENKDYVLLVKKLWNSTQGRFAKVNVVGEVPLTPFSMASIIHIATEEQIITALGLGLEKKKSLNLGKIMHTSIDTNISLKKLGRVFITGKSGSGKSYTVGVLIEELMKKKVPLVIIDRHGEYSALKILDKANIPKDEKFFVDVEDLEDQESIEFEDAEDDDDDDVETTIVRNVEETEDEEEKTVLRSHAENIIEFGDPEVNPNVDLDIKFLLSAPLGEIIIPGHVIIVNLRGQDIVIQENIIETLCSRIYNGSVRGEIPPHYMFIDEAHLFAGKKKKPITETLKLLAQEGRKFGANLVVITQKPQALDTTIRAQAGTWIIHQLTDVNDIKMTANSAEGLSKEMEDEIQNFRQGQAIITGETTPFSPLMIQVRLRYTKHGGAGFNILDYLDKENNIPKTELVAKLKNNIPVEARNSAGQDIMVSNKISSSELHRRIDVLNKMNEELNRQLDLLKKRPIKKVQSESDSVSSEELMILQLEVSDLKVKTEKYKDKYKEEKQRADEAILVSEKLIEKLRKFANNKKK